MLLLPTTGTTTGLLRHLGCTHGRFMLFFFRIYLLFLKLLE